MVRYSKLPFRLLVGDRGADMLYTPMIVASSFLQSDISRDIEFQTCSGPKSVAALLLVARFRCTGVLHFSFPPCCPGAPAHQSASSFNFASPPPRTFPPLFQIDR